MVSRHPAPQGAGIIANTVAGTPVIVGKSLVPIAALSGSRQGDLLQFFEAGFLPGVGEVEIPNPLRARGPGVIVGEQFIP
jgi:hypothetical protein